MTKKAKLEQYDSVAQQALITGFALNAVLNGTTSRAFTVHETEFSQDDCAKGCSYAFRFFEMQSGYSYAIVTFRCKTTGQSDSTIVYCVEDIKESPYFTSNWYKIALKAIGEWRESQRKAVAA